MSLITDLIFPSATQTTSSRSTSGSSVDQAAEAFGEGLTSLIEDADAKQKTAEAQIRERAAGEGDLVQTMVALSDADLSLRMVVNVRNRALEAYQEIMRMPV